MKKKRNIILLIIVLLVVARIFLPYFLEKYVNRVLNDIPGYVGHVDDIDVALYRGAYVIEGLQLDKKETHLSVPLLNFPKTDISIEWDALFKGRIVSEIILHNPQINYTLSNQKEKPAQEEAEVKDWREALKDLVPIEINHLQAHNGVIKLFHFSEDPNVNLAFENIDLQATNLRNVESKTSPIPSSVHATAVSFGGGTVTLDGKLDVMKRIPNMDMEFSLQDADVTALNDTFLKIGGLDFARGTFELYAEAAIADGYLKGYLKPMFIDTELIGEEDKGFFEKLWEGFVGVFKFLFKNQGTDTLATRAPFEGDLNNIDEDMSTTILNIFKNAWFDAFSTEVEEDIQYEDARVKSQD